MAGKIDADKIYRGTFLAKEGIAMMKRCRTLVLGALLLLNLLVACGPISNNPGVSFIEHYATILKQEGTTLNLYWPANDTVATWIKQTLVPGYKKFIQDTYGVSMTVNVLPTTGGDDAFFTRLQDYEHSAKPGSNTFDTDVARIVPSPSLIDAAQSGWFQPILSNPYGFSISNLSHINRQGRNIFMLNGDVKTLYAVPFYQPTISFFYNKNRIKASDLPKTLDELLAWVKKHPRRFTYEDPTSPSGFGSGIMFLIAVMHAKGDTDNVSTSEGFQYLKALQPYLYPEPAAPDGLRNLMKHDDIWLMPYWNNDGLSEAQSFDIPFMANYFPSDRTPVRNTPIAIPRSAQHKLAALIFMNYALSDDTQMTMAEQIRQFPANTDDTVLHALPANTFGYNINDITNDIFPSYDSAANLQWIQSLIDRYPQKVLQ
jgi:spermidine/putrescine-binding protein